MILLDTDHLSLLQARDAPVAFTLQARLEAFSPDEVVATVIALEEQVRQLPQPIFAGGTTWRVAPYSSRGALPRAPWHYSVCMSYTLYKD